MKSVLVAVGCAFMSLSIGAQSVARRPLEISSQIQQPLGIASGIQRPLGITSGTPDPRGAALNHARIGVASDWTQHHALYSAAKNLAVTTRIEKDPRWTQEWYLRHREVWWPRAGHGQLKRLELVQRDWSVPLGTTSTNGIPTFEPMFDFNYSLSGGFEQGFGTLNSFDLVAAHLSDGGAYWATNGSVNVTAGLGMGIYPLTPGGPGATAQTFPPSEFYNFNNVLFPGYPALAPIFTAFDGVSFGSPVGGNNLLFVESGGTVFNDVYDGGNFAGSVNGTPGTNINTDPGGGQTYPAKYTFDVTEAPSCANDFVAIGIPANAVAGSSGQANIVGYNNLYTPTDGTSDTCPGTGPAVMFAYASGTGEVPGSISLSQDGTQLAYVEDQLTGSSVFHILTIGTSSGNEGTSPTDPATPGTGGSNAVDAAVPLSGGSGSCAAQSSTTSPFIKYSVVPETSDAAYVTTYAWTGTGTGTGCLYKISPVFTVGTPTIEWSLPLTAVPSSPVYDPATNNVFFTDSSGNIDSVTDTGTPSTYTSLAVAAGTTSENPVTVDSTDGMVYATFNFNGTGAAVVQATTSLASFASVPVGLGNTFFTGPYGVDFSNVWYTSGPTSAGALLYVAGTDATTGLVPTLYSVGFGNVTAGVMDTATASSTALSTTTNAVTTAATVADASDVTEFYNATTSTDYLFAGVTDSCAATTGGGTSGCVMSLNITSGAPTVSISTTAIAAPGGSTGLVVDNDASTTPVTGFPQAASIYYGTKDGGTLVKATQSGLQ
jgi:hypothetical protein